MANKHHTMNEPQTTTLTTDDIRPWDWDSEFGAELNREVRKRLIGCRAIADWLREHGDDMAPFQCDDAERRQLSDRLERHTAAQDLLGDAWGCALAYIELQMKIGQAQRKDESRA